MFGSEKPGEDPFRTGVRYNEKGEYIGYTMPGPLGSDNLFNADGSYAGHAIPTADGCQQIVDPEGRWAGYNMPNDCGGYINFNTSSQLSGFTIRHPSNAPFDAFDQDAGDNRDDFSGESFDF